MPENISGVPAGRSVFHLTSPFIGLLDNSGWIHLREMGVLRPGGLRPSCRIRSEAHAGTLRGIARLPQPTYAKYTVDSGLELPHGQSSRENRNHADGARGGRAILSKGAARHRR